MGQKSRFLSFFFYEEKIVPTIKTVGFFYPTIFMRFSVSENVGPLCGLACKQAKNGYFPTRIKEASLHNYK